MRWGPRYRNWGPPLPIDGVPGVTRRRGGTTESASDPARDFDRARDLLKVARSSNRPDFDRVTAAIDEALVHALGRSAQVEGGGRDRDERLVRDLAARLHREVRRARGASAGSRSGVLEGATPRVEGAGIGAMVATRDLRTGDESVVRIVRARERPGEVTPASPIGRALVGARAGDRVVVRRPSGGSSELEVLSVTPEAHGDPESVG
jgi:transcription elongation GreA/GreB family factor